HGLRPRRLQKTTPNGSSVQESLWHGILPATEKWRSAPDTASTTRTSITSRFCSTRFLPTMGPSHSPVPCFLFCRSLVAYSLRPRADLPCPRPAARLRRREWKPPPKRPPSTQ